MNDLIYWLLMALIQLIIYLLPSISLPKGKWIRKKDTASTSLSISVDPMQGLSSKTKFKGEMTNGKIL